MTFRIILPGGRYSNKLVANCESKEIAEQIVKQHIKGHFYLIAVADILSNSVWINTVISENTLAIMRGVAAMVKSWNLFTKSYS